MDVVLPRLAIDREAVLCAVVLSIDVDGLCL